MSTIYTYELLEISWALDYDFREEVSAQQKKKKHTDKVCFSAPDGVAPFTLMSGASRRGLLR